MTTFNRHTHPDTITLEQAKKWLIANGQHDLVTMIEEDFPEDHTLTKVDLIEDCVYYSFRQPDGNAIEFGVEGEEGTPSFHVGVHMDFGDVGFGIL